MIITTECELRKLIIEAYKELKRRKGFLALSVLEQGTVNYFKFYAMPMGKTSFRVSLTIHGLKSVPREYKNILGQSVDMLDMADIKTDIWNGFMENKSDSEFDNLLEAFKISDFCVTTNERCRTSYLAS